MLAFSLVREKISYCSPVFPHSWEHLAGWWISPAAKLSNKLSLFRRDFFPTLSRPVLILSPTQHLPLLRQSWSQEALWQTESPDCFLPGWLPVSRALCLHLHQQKSAQLRFNIAQSRHNFVLEQSGMAYQTMVLAVCTNVSHSSYKK